MDEQRQQEHEDQDRRAAAEATDELADAELERAAGGGSHAGGDIQIKGTDITIKG